SMLRKMILPAALATAAIAALTPSSASAQTYFGFSLGSGYPAYAPDYYYAPGYYDDPRAAWYARDRWRHERWEREEARRRYWHEYGEHHRWHGDDDDDDGD